MRLTINDTPVDFNNLAISLEQAVSHSGVSDFKGIAAAVNNTVIPRANWNTFQLKENDTITIIRATQGG